MQFFRNIGNVPHIFRNVVADDSVASGQCPEQYAVTICQADCCTVKFQFAGICKRSTYGFGRSRHEILNFADIVSVPQRKHRIFVGILGEFFPRGRHGLSVFVAVFQIAAYLARRGVRSYQIRILVFQVGKFIHEMVIVIITYDRIILHIVLAAVFPENFPEFLYSIFCLLARHFPSFMYIHTRIYL